MPELCAYSIALDCLRHLGTSRDSFPNCPPCHVVFIAACIAGPLSTLSEPRPAFKVSNELILKLTSLHQTSQIVSITRSLAASKAGPSENALLSTCAGHTASQC